MNIFQRTFFFIIAAVAFGLAAWASNDSVPIPTGMNLVVYSLTPAGLAMLIMAFGKDRDIIFWPVRLCFCVFMAMLNAGMHIASREHFYLALAVVSATLCLLATRKTACQFGLLRC